MMEDWTLNGNYYISYQGEDVLYDLSSSWGDNFMPWVLKAIQNQYLTEMVPRLSDQSSQDETRSSADPLK